MLYGLARCPPSPGRPIEAGLVWFRGGRQHGPTERRMDDVVWGIIGCGDVCERKSGPPLYQLPHSRLEGVTRRDLDAARDFAARHGVPQAFNATDDLLAVEAINAIYVATPDAFHEEGTLAAAKAGKHVMVEKAMATDAAACTRMIDTCAEMGVTLAVAYYRRCYPSILRVQQLLADGAIGDLQELRLNDEFPLSHRLDLVHFFCGDCQEVWQETTTCMANDHTGAKARSCMPAPRPGPSP